MQQKRHAWARTPLHESTTWCDTINPGEGRGEYRYDVLCASPRSFNLLINLGHQCLGMVFDWMELELAFLELGRMDHDCMDLGLIRQDKSTIETRHYVKTQLSSIIYWSYTMYMIYESTSSWFRQGISSIEVGLVTGASYNMNKAILHPTTFCVTWHPSTILMGSQLAESKYHIIISQFQC